jgi:YidC/Oxa1 family membrane protein insertase
MPNSPSSIPPEPPSFEKRLPLALALMMLVLLGWQYFFKAAPAPKPAAPATSAPATSAPATSAPTVRLSGEKPVPSPAVPANAGNAAAAGVIAPTEGISETTTDIDSDLYHIVFTNRGAVVKSWVLKKYKDDAGKPLQLINPGDKFSFPFAIDFTGQKPAFDPNAVLYQTKVSNGGDSIDFEYSDGRTRIHKSFEFTKDTYLSTVKSFVLDNGTDLPHVLTWRGGFGDNKAFKEYTKINAIHYDAGTGKLVKKVAKDAKNGPFSETGNFTFGGLEDEFFAAVALPPDNTPLEIRTYSDGVKVAGESEDVQYAGVGLSTGPQNSFSFFVGPKDTHLLESVNPKLGTLIDWGFFGILAKPLFVSLHYVADHWTFHNYGWAIILVTLIINAALFPIRLSSLKSARKMQKLQPQLKAINDKYKNIKINDPRKAEQNQEVMALYKTQGVNPVGGCLPMILQLPFFYAFYKVLSISIDLRHAPWLWVSDLSSPETFFIHVLPLVMIASQFFMQKMTPAAGVDPNQQRMMMFMPLALGFFFYNLSSGLVLYYLTGNLVGIVFQLIVNRFMPVPPPPPAPAVKAPVKSAVKK